MEEIVSKIIKSLKGFKAVQAIAFGGSHMHDCEDEFSDVDIYVFFKGKIPDKKEREKFFSKLDDFEKYISAEIVDYFIFKGLHIHTWWESLEDLKKKLKDKNDIGTRCLVLYPKIVWDNGELRKVRSKMKFPNKKQRDSLVIKSFSGTPVIFRLVVRKSLKRRRFYFIEWSINKKVEDLISAIYVMNGKFYCSYPNHLESDFKKFKIVPRGAYANINRIGRLSLYERPMEKLTALFELYWETRGIAKRKFNFPREEVFPEYDSKKWFLERIIEISKIIEEMKRKGTLKV
jgi:predicted nucleotidyltransferase